MSTRRERIAERDAWLEYAEGCASDGRQRMSHMIGIVWERYDNHCDVAPTAMDDDFTPLSRSLFCLLMALECMECEP